MIFGKHINRYYLRYGPVLVLGIVALILVDYAQLVIPELYQMVINGMKEGSVVVDGVTFAFDLDFLLDRICLPLCIIILVMVVGRFGWRVCFWGSSIRMERDLRNRMFDHAKDLSRSYYQINKVGNLMSLFTNDLDTIQECFGFGIMEFCDAVFLGALAIIKMAKMDGWLTLYAMIPMAFLLAGALVLGKYLTIKWETRQAAFSDLSDFSQESFSGIAVIKAFVKETLELCAFRKLNKKNEDVNVDYTRFSTLMHICVTLFVESVTCVILGYGGYLVYIEKFNAGQLIQFIGYFTAVVWPVMAVSELIDMSSRGNASLRRVSELLEAPIDVTDSPEVTEAFKGKEPVALKGEITFSNLTFRYPDGEYDALQNISFTIRAGQSVGLVGKTGAGKTTLVDLILRTYNVPNGTIFMDGQDVNTLPIRDVRAACAYVPQDNFLFSETIEDNIAFACDDKDPAGIEDAARQSDIHDNIMEFKDGYATVLGERGVTVSGGQKQRISIARALMKNAPVLILDDSVSAVDTKTEKIILENLKTRRKGKTTILIAHRVSTIEGMDLILFLDDGKLIAAGDYSTLYETCPAFHRMVDLQKLEEEGGEDAHA